MAKKSGNSIQDQLLKAGLTSEKKVKQVKNQQYKAKKTAKQSKQEAPDLTAIELEKQRQEKLERDRLLNKQKEEAAKAKAIVAQIYQLIEMNRISVRGDVKYNFSHDKKVKFILVNSDLQRELSDGRVGIVLDRDKRYAMVPAGVINKIALRDDAYIISLHDKKANASDSSESENDPYADFEVPDDLMW